MRGVCRHTRARARTRVCVCVRARLTVRCSCSFVAAQRNTKLAVSHFVPYGVASRDSRFSAPAQLALEQASAVTYHTVASANELRSALASVNDDAATVDVFRVKLAHVSHEQIGLFVLCLLV